AARQRGTVQIQNRRGSVLVADNGEVGGAVERSTVLIRPQIDVRERTGPLARQIDYLRLSRRALVGRIEDLLGRLVESESLRIACRNQSSKSLRNGVKRDETRARLRNRTSRSIQYPEHGNPVCRIEQHLSGRAGLAVARDRDRSRSEQGKGVFVNQIHEPGSSRAADNYHQTILGIERGAGRGIAMAEHDGSLARVGDVGVNAE